MTWFCRGMNARWLLGIVLLVACGDTDPAIDSGADAAADVAVDAIDAALDVAVDTTVANDTATGMDTSLPTDCTDDCWRSELYPEDWTPAFTRPDGAYLHDFSYAGAFNGEAPLPTVDGPLFDVTGAGADATGASDSTEAFQTTIDLAELIGGVVWVPAGTYRIDGQLTVDESNVVVRGEGETSRVFFTKTEAITNQGHLRFQGRANTGATTALTADASSRQHHVEVEDASALNVGDEIGIGFRITPAFIERHGMTGTWVSFTDQHKHFYRRTITAIDGSRVEFKVPLRDEIRVSDGAELRVFTGLLDHVGVENLAVSTAVSAAAAQTVDRTHAIRMDWVRDSWVVGLTSFASPAGENDDHFMSGGIKLLDVHRVTVRDSELELAQNLGGGGNGYLFEVSKSNDVLFADNIARRGRHNFIQNWDFGTSGVVWLRCESYDGTAINSGFRVLGFSEFHHSLATANLIDSNVSTDGWAAVNRNNYSSGAGLSAKENVFWNHRGGALRSFQFGLGYVIGTEDVALQIDLDMPDFTGQARGTAPQDYAEGVDEGARLMPRSLYEDQLARRLAE